MGFGVFLLQIMRIICGRDGKTEVGRDAKHPLGDELFFGNAVVLHLQPEPVPAERPGEPGGTRLSGLVIPLAEIQRDLPGEAGGEPDDPLVVLLQHLFVDARPAVIALEKSNG